MPGRYATGRGDLPGLILPPGWAEQLRTLLARIEAADTPVNCLLAQERAMGRVEGLEMAKACDAQDLEQLFVLIDDAAQRRLQQLQDGAG